MTTQSVCKLLLSVKNRKILLKPERANPTNQSDTDMNNEFHVNPAIFLSINGLLASSREIIHFMELQFQIFNRKLNKIEELLTNHFESIAMKVTKNKITVFKSKIANELKKEDGLLDLNIITKMRNDLHEIFNTKKIDLELEQRNTQKNDPSLDEKIQILEYGLDLLIVGNEMEI